MRILSLPTCSSTNTMAKAFLGQVDAISTFWQTQGRGRQQRRWHSRPFQDLTFSLLLPRIESSLPYFTAVFLAELLEKRWELPIQLKWPNDLYCHNKKLAGILCETQNNYTVVGIGLNLNTPRLTDTSLQAISLQEILGKRLALKSTCLFLLLGLWNQFQKDARSPATLFALYNQKALPNITIKRKNLLWRFQGLTKEGKACFENPLYGIQFF